MIAVALVAAGCAGAENAPSTLASPTTSAGSTTVSVQGGGTYTSVVPGRLKEMLAAKDFILVNVHVPYEGEIEPTDLFIPYEQVQNRLGELPASKDAKILVYCRSGRMSTIAANTLVGLGYTNVWELRDGFQAWTAAGYPLANKPPG